MSQFGFDRVLQNMEKVKKDLPPVLANLTQTHFVQAFNKQGFDEGHKPWQEVKRRIPGTPEYKYPKNKGLGRRTKAILSGSGRLKRAVNNSIKEATFDKIKLSVSENEVPYASVHNEGGKAGRNHAANIPKREFMGDSNELRAKQKKKIDEMVDKIWNT